jgi:hypothetical protein
VENREKLLKTKKSARYNKHQVPGPVPKKTRKTSFAARLAAAAHPLHGIKLEV